MPKLTIVGAGVMGEAVTRGLLASGWSASDVLLTDVRGDHLRAVGSRLGVPVEPDNAAAASSAPGVLLAVKPVDAPSALDQIREALVRTQGGVMSIVAMLRTEMLEERLAEGTPVVRAMPNTPARVGKGVTALAAGSAATPALRDLASEVFGAVGPVVWVAEEHLDAVTALSASGPGYLFLVAEAMVDAGVALGLPRDVAATLTYATIEGSGALLVESGEHPAVLRAQVTTPGGTTAAGVSVLEGMAVRAAFIEAIRAAWRRSREYTP